jgi:hypothetical protein
MKTDRLSGVSAFFMVFAVTGAALWAQDKAACTMLAAGELGSIGVQGAGIPSEMPIAGDPAKGTMKMCNWKLAAGGLTLVFYRIPPGATRESLGGTVKRTYEALKSRGWTEEKKDFGSISCIIMTPPAGAKENMGVNTVCMTESKGFAVSLTSVSRSAVHVEDVKTAIANAAGRL